MFTPIGFFAPQGGALPNIVTDSLEIWADPNHSTLSYTSGVTAGTIQNLASTAYTISFGNVTTTPYDSSAISFSVGTAGGKSYFLPNGSHPYGNDINSDQGFVDLTSPWSSEAWVYFPTGTSNPYYYNNESMAMNVVYRWPSTTIRSLFIMGHRRWSDATNRYKFFEIFTRDDSNNAAATGNYPLGATQFNDGQWHHWCVTGGGSGGNVKLYLDGVDQSTDFTFPAGAFSNTTLCYFGGSGGGDYRCFQGGARGGSFRWYSKVLSAAEVAQNYNAEVGTFG